MGSSTQQLAIANLRVVAFGQLLDEAVSL